MNAQTIKECDIVPAITVKENESVVEVAKKLHHFQERRIFVLNNKKYPIGIISVVDINDRVVARGRDPKKTKARDIMSYPLTLIVDINDSAKEVLKKMVQKDNYYVPVINKGKLVGLLIYSNLIKIIKK